MGKVAVVVAVAALGAAGWSAWSLQEVRKELASLRGEVELLSPLEARLAALEAKGAAAAPPPALPGAPRASEPDESLLAPAPRAVVAASAAPSSKGPPRVEELEKRLAALEEKDKGRIIDATDAIDRGATHFSSLGRARGFYATPADAAKELELDPAQKADLDRIVGDARRELEDLRKLPDEDGKSYEQIQKDMMEGIKDGALRFDLGKVLAWNGKTIPGRNETFGAADRHIRENAKARIRETLRPEQQSKLDKATIDPMLGGSGPGMVMSFSTTVDAIDEAPAGK